jgi:hypothetical protein
MYDYIKTIAYKEGAEAFRDNILITRNPYDGVMAILQNAWEEGWFDAFESEL